MQRLISNEDQLYYIENFIPDIEAEDYHIRLFKELEWQEEPSVENNTLATVAYLMCWYADPWVDCIYNGITHQPRVWTPLLKEIKSRVEKQTEHTFNGVLAY